MVCGSKLLMILARRPLLLYLRCHGRHTLLTLGGNFRRQWPARHTAGAVVAHAIRGRIVYDSVGYHAIVNSHVHIRYVVCRAVVMEAVPAPVPTLIAGARVSKSIINSAVIADMMAPESIVIAIPAAGVSPIAWRPQQACLRWLHPSSRHPVIAAGAIAPVSRRPEVAISGTVRLRIFRQRRRSVGLRKLRLPVA
jgi:hypothetical protein